MENDPTVEPAAPPYEKLRGAINRFVAEVRAIRDATPIAIGAIAEAAIKTTEDFDSFLKKNCEEIVGEDDRAEPVEGSTSKTRYKIPPEHITQFRDKFDASIHLLEACRIIPRSSIITLVSQYDAFLSSILEFLFLKHPHMINVDDIKIGLKDILQFSSLDELRSSIIDQRVQNIMYMSHFDQIGWLEKNMKFSFLCHYKDIGGFVECIERRNLFVHTNGRVSNKYLQVCRKHNIEVGDNIYAGCTVKVKPQYIYRASRIFLEVGVLVGHIVWRKLFPESVDESDGCITELAYQLIRAGRYVPASNILEFYLKHMADKSTERIRRMNVINLANAHRLSERREACEALVKQFDWSASGFEFRLAEAVLLENYGLASKIMKSIGSQGSVKKSDYRQWPLFIGFRDTAEFLQAFEEIFGESFAFSEPKSDEIPTALSQRDADATSPIESA